MVERRCVLIKTVLLGFGYWGPNLARNFQKSPHFELIGIIEVDHVKQARIRMEYPNVLVFDSIEDFESAGLRIDAAIVATPSATHFQYAKYFLVRGCHVWVEKPFVLNSNEGELLTELANRKQLRIFVDHTFQYSPAVREIKNNLSTIGQITYINSTRSNFGIIQSDTSVIWDLAVHDFSIVQYLIEQSPQSVIAKSSSPFSGIQDSVCSVILDYGSFLASIHVNWLSPFKSRDFLIGGTNSSILFDDTETAEKVKIYSQSIAALPELGPADIRQFDYKYGSVTIPNVQNEESLETAVKSFASYILEKIEPPSSGRLALELIRILEACEESIKSGGSSIILETF